MTDEERDALIRRLGELMSELSEKCYYAGWMRGTEYFVPELCRRALATDEAQPWGHGTVEPAPAAELVAIATELGHWVDLDPAGIGYVAHNPFPVPAEYLETLLEERARTRPNAPPRSTHPGR